MSTLYSPTLIQGTPLPEADMGKMQALFQEFRDGQINGITGTAFEAGAYLLARATGEEMPEAYHKQHYEGVFEYKKGMTYSEGALRAKYWMDARRAEHDIGRNGGGLGGFLAGLGGGIVSGDLLLFEGVGFLAARGLAAENALIRGAAGEYKTIMNPAQWYTRGLEGLSQQQVGAEAARAWSASRWSQNLANSTYQGLVMNTVMEPSMFVMGDWNQKPHDIADSFMSIVVGAGIGVVMSPFHEAWNSVSPSLRNHIGSRIVQGILSGEKATLATMDPRAVAELHRSVQEVKARRQRGGRVSEIAEEMVKSPETLGDLINKRVRYLGEEGTLVQESDGTIVLQSVGADGRPRIVEVANTGKDLSMRAVEADVFTAQKDITRLTRTQRDHYDQLRAKGATEEVAYEAALRSPTERVEKRTFPDEKKRIEAERKLHREIKTLFDWVKRRQEDAKKLTGKKRERAARALANDEANLKRMIAEYQKDFPEGENVATESKARRSEVVAMDEPGSEPLLMHMAGRRMTWNGHEGILAQNEAGQWVLQTDDTRGKPKYTNKIPLDQAAYPSDVIISKARQYEPFSHSGLELSERDTGPAKRAAREITAADRAKETFMDRILPSGDTVSEAYRKVARLFRSSVGQTSREAQIANVQSRNNVKRLVLNTDQIDMLVKKRAVTKEQARIAREEGALPGEASPYQERLLLEHAIETRDARKVEFMRAARKAETYDQKLVAEVMRVVFGTDVMFVPENVAKGTKFMGMYSPDTPGHIYVRMGDLEGRFGMLHLAGHEMGHVIRMRDPSMWFSMVDVMLNPEVNKYFGEAWRDVARSPEIKSHLRENAFVAMDETLCNVLGIAMRQPAFWKELRGVSKVDAAKLSGQLLKLREHVVKMGKKLAENLTLVGYDKNKTRFIALEAQLAEIVSAMNEAGTDYAFKDQQKLIETWDLSLDDEGIPHGTDSRAIMANSYLERVSAFRKMRLTADRNFQSTMLKGVMHVDSWEELAEELLPDSTSSMTDRSSTEGGKKKFIHKMTRRGISDPQVYLLDWVMRNHSSIANDLKAVHGNAELEKVFNNKTIKKWLKDQMPLARWDPISEPYDKMVDGKLKKVTDYSFELHSNDDRPVWTEVREGLDWSDFTEDQEVHHEVYRGMAESLALAADSVIKRARRNNKEATIGDLMRALSPRKGKQDVQEMVNAKIKDMQRDQGPLGQGGDRRLPVNAEDSSTAVPDARLLKELRQELTLEIRDSLRDSLKFLQDFSPAQLREKLTKDGWRGLMKDYTSFLEELHAKRMLNLHRDEVTGLTDAAFDSGLRLRGIEEALPKAFLLEYGERMELGEKVAKQKKEMLDKFLNENPQMQWAENVLDGEPGLTGKDINSRWVYHSDFEGIGPRLPDIPPGDIVDTDFYRAFMDKRHDLIATQMEFILTKGRYHTIAQVMLDLFPAKREEFLRKIAADVDRILFDNYANLRPALELYHRQFPGAKYDPTSGRSGDALRVLNENNGIKFRTRGFLLGEEFLIDTKGDSTSTYMTKNQGDSTGHTGMDMPLDEVMRVSEAELRAERARGTSSFARNRALLQAMSDEFAPWLKDVANKRKELQKALVKLGLAEPPEAEIKSPEALQLETEDAAFEAEVTREKGKPPKPQPKPATDKDLSPAVLKLKEELDSIKAASRAQVKDVDRIAKNYKPSQGKDAVDGDIAEMMFRRNQRRLGGTRAAIDQTVQDVKDYYMNRAYEVVSDHMGREGIRSWVGRGIKQLKTMMDGMGRSGVRIQVQSIDFLRKARRDMDYTPFEQTLLVTGMSDLWENGTGVKVVMAHMHPKGKKSTIPGVIEVAKVLTMINDMQAGRINSLGGAYRYLPGYMMSRIHDPAQIALNRKGWTEFMHKNVNWDVMLGENSTVAARTAFVEKLYQEIVESPVPTNPEEATLLARSQKHREIEFLPDVDADYLYDVQFGSTRPGAEIVAQLRSRAETSVFMEHFGANFRRNWDAIMAENGLRYREGAWEELRVADRIFQTMVGALDNPVDVTLARRSQSLMKSVGLGILSTAGISQIADFVNIADTMRFFGKPLPFINSEFMQSVKLSLNDVRAREAFKAMGSVMESDMRARMRIEADGIHGLVDWLHDGAMKYTGLEMGTRVAQDIAYDQLSLLWGENGRNPKSADPQFWNAIEYHGLTKAEFMEASKYVGKIEGVEGWRMAPELIPDHRLSLKVRAAQMNAVSHAQLQPSVGNQATLRHGTQAGTPSGVAMRFFAMYKEYMVALATKMQARFNYGYGSVEAPKFGMIPKGGGMSAKIIWSANMLAVSLVILAIKDLLRGKEPLNPFDKDHWNWNNIGRIVTTAGIGPFAIIENLGSNVLGPVGGKAVDVATAFTNDSPNSTYDRINTAMGFAPWALAGPLALPMQEGLKVLFADAFSNAYAMHLKMAHDFNERETKQHRFLFKGPNNP